MWHETSPEHYVYGTQAQIERWLIANPFLAQSIRQ